MAILLKICSFHVVYMQKTIDFYYKNNYNYIVMFTITFMERSVQVWRELISQRKDKEKENMASEKEWKLLTGEMF